MLVAYCLPYADNTVNTQAVKSTVLCIGHVQSDTEWVHHSHHEWMVQ